MSKLTGATMSLLLILAVAACGREATQAPPPSIPPQTRFAFGPGSSQPAGLWAFFDTDATTKDLGSQWVYGGNWGDRLDATEPVQRDLNHVTVVDDPGTPSGKALRILYPNCAGGVCAGFSGAAFWNDWRGYVPNGADYPEWAGQALSDLSDLYIRVLIKLEPGWQFHTATDKLFYYGGCGDSSPGTSADFYPSIFGSSQLRWRNQGGNGGDKAQFRANGSASPASGSWTGDWFELEIYMKAQSSPGASDGVLRLWLDGRRVLSWNKLGSGQTKSLDGDAQWYAVNDRCLGFFGFQWGLFWGGAAQERTGDQYMRYGGLYLSGRR